MLFSAELAAQVCNANIERTAPDGRYSDNGDGTVTDLRTGLMWKQCSEGQSGTDCSGSAPTRLWQSALQLADTAQFAGYDDWRLPNLKELASLLETSCSSPSINTNLFPNTVTSEYWTSSPYAYVSNNAWLVDFYDGGTWYYYMYNLRHVRLVRNGQALPFEEPPSEAPSVRFTGENLPDYSYQVGGAVKHWRFRNGVAALSGLKAVADSQDAGLGIGVTEIPIGDLAADVAFSIELPITPEQGGAAIKSSVWHLVDGAGNPVPIDNSANNDFWLKLRTNRPPRFDPSMPTQLAGAAGQALSLRLQGVDADGDTLSFALVDVGGVAGITLQGDQLQANVSDADIAHPVVVSVSDGVETAQATVNVLTFTQSNIFNFYADVNGAGVHDDAILFTTLQGLLIGSEGEGGSRLFHPNALPTWSELLGMLVSAAAAVDAIEIPTHNLLKAPGPVPSWVDKHYTVALLVGAVDADVDLAAQPTQEDATRLIVKLLRLDSRVVELDLTGLLPSFTAPICAGEGQSGCFSSEQRRYEAQIARLFGLHLLLDGDDPQGGMLRGQLAEVMARIMQLPAATLNLSATELERDDPLMISLSDLRAPLIRAGGEFLIDEADQPDPAAHMSLRQLFLDGQPFLVAEQPLAGFTSYTLETQELTPGRHQLVAMLKNQDSDTYAYLPAAFVVATSDRDGDGVQDRIDLWPDDNRYVEDTNGNQIPDSLDRLWDLEGVSGADPVYLDGIYAGYTYAEAITNGYPIDGPDDDGDGINDHVDPDPLYPPPTGCSNTDNPIIGGTVVYANGDKEACVATTSITTQPTVTIQSGADVIYRAPIITLGTGFTVKAGGRFQAGPQIDTNGYGGSTKAIDTTGVSSPAHRVGVTAVVGPVRLTHSELPTRLRSLLDSYGAVAEEIFADATGNLIVFATETALSGMDSNGHSDIYLYEVSTDLLSPLSVNANGQTGNAASTQPRIDGGGNYVVYASQASDLIADDTNGVSDIFITELATGLTVRISLGESGKQATKASQNPAISSNRPQLLYDRQDNSGRSQVYSYDYNWPIVGTQQLSRGENDQGIPVDSHHADISPNGQYVAYYETSGSAPDVANCQIMLYDQITAEHHRQACPTEAIQDGQYQYIAVDNAGAVVNW